MEKNNRPSPSGTLESMEWMCLCDVKERYHHVFASLSGLLLANLSNTKRSSFLYRGMLFL